MKKFIILFVTLLIINVNYSFAHIDGSKINNQNQIIFVSTLTNKVEIKNTDKFIEIRSNGIPDHPVGQFPRKGNPNKISEQFHFLQITKFPKFTKFTIASRFFGIAVNGIMFIPGTAGCFNGNRQSIGSCEWRAEAIVDGKLKLGLDYNYGHVQRSGMYHYHGFPRGLVDRLKINSSNNDLIKVGFAGDGFGIFISKKDKYKSSYQLRKGNRESGPLGKFDGSYTNDYKFVAKSGDLDECNGFKNGQDYFYLITKSFPYIPRCWAGKPDQSFLKRPDNRNR